MANRFSSLTDIMYYILISLISPLHSYGAINKVEKMSKERVWLAVGTLYSTINTLLNNDLIVLIGVDETHSNIKRNRLMFRRFQS